MREQTKFVMNGRKMCQFVCVKFLCISGRYLLGLLQSGELFVWHKDKDIIKIIPSLSKLTKNYQAGVYFFHISNFEKIMHQDFS